MARAVLLTALLAAIALTAAGVAGYLLSLL